MKLYDEKIRQAGSLLEGISPKAWPFTPEAAWRDLGSNELILGRDAAYELGGSDLHAATYTCFTSDPGLVPTDQVLLYGPDLRQLKQDTPFARISLIRTGSLPEGDDQIHTALQNIEFVKYRVHPEGYMIRTSVESHREQVRVSKAALKKGISFYSVGTAYIREYKKNPLVLSACVIFVTDPRAPYEKLEAAAKETDGVTKALSHILEGLPTDCASCTLKPICDEVEGMKELHFKGAK